MTPARRPIRPSDIRQQKWAGLGYLEESQGEIPMNMGDIEQDDPRRRRRGAAAADEAGPGTEVDDEVEPICEECAPRVVAPDPGQPTQKEIEEHRIDHMPFRSWCEHCVAGRATGEQHRAVGDKRLVPVISFDYLFVLKSGKMIERRELQEQEVDVKRRRVEQEPLHQFERMKLHVFPHYHQQDENHQFGIRCYGMLVARDNADIDYMLALDL